MASSQFNNYIVAPNPAATTTFPATYSASNVPRYTNTDISLTGLASVANGATALIYTVNANNFPNSNASYRFTCGWQCPSLTFASTPVNGNISLLCQYNGRNFTQSTSFAKSSVTGLSPYVGGNVSGVVSYANGGTVQIYLANDTGQTLNAGGSLTFNNMCVEPISTSNVVVTSFV